MKLAPAIAWFLATSCLVGQVVFGQPTTEEDVCSSTADDSSSGGDLRKLVRHTNELVQQVLSEVRKTDCQLSLQHVSSNAVALLQSTTYLIVLSLLKLQL